MKGIVFTEFMEMVESKFDEDMLEGIIDDAGVSGVYTSIGTYPHTDMIQLVMALSSKSGIEIPELLRVFGGYLFSSFTRLYPHFFEDIDNSFDFLQQVEGFIHVQVKKIYPNAELPRFETKRLNPSELQMIYYSDRRMGALAVGLIQGCMEHFKDDGEVKIVDSSNDDTVVTFLIRLAK
ncbi:MAG: heme NO-binding domain-containing protein [Crocinitomicaceae bacterium]|nr:heme NO-binding domain-containing protein [Crocinitomicaceae bacterium]